MLTAPSPSSQTKAGRERKLTTDDAPAAVVAAVGVEQVHRAAAPVRTAVAAAEQLGHDRLGRCAAGQREAVGAVAGDEQVVVLHRVDDADAGRLLARGEVAVAADAGGLVLTLGLRLEHADEQHLLVHGEQVGVRCDGQGVQASSK
jgi:hypothetical protein